LTEFKQNYNTDHSNRNWGWESHWYLWLRAKNSFRLHICFCILG